MYGLTFLVADLVMIVCGYWAGWRFIKHHRNYLLGIEWFIVATSGTNFLVWALRFADDPEGGEASGQYAFAFFLDAFSRSVGITLLLVVGLMAVTHRYKAPLAVEIGIFALAIGSGLYLAQPKYRAHVDENGEFLLHPGPATFYVVVNLLTLAFLLYVVKRLWDIGATRVAVATLAVSLAGTVIALTYDFFPLPDSVDPLEDRALFYTFALTVWGLQMLTYLFAYRALDAHDAARGLEPAHEHGRPVRA
ncbi:transporter [Pimelobacter simplex]|nr:transporter [Pimelobacter simplex]